MSAPPAIDPLTLLAARLRAAGCVFAEDEARLLLAAAETPADLAIMTERRITGLPLEHVLGWVQFCDLRIAVDPHVFVPRRRTEFLVTQAAALLRQGSGPSDSTRDQRPDRDQPAGCRPGAVVVDLCCGSGALGVAILTVSGQLAGPRTVVATPTSADLAGPRVELHAVDVDPDAVGCARRNILPVGGWVYQGDLYDPLPARLRGRVEILVANAPYVPTDSIELLPPEARLYEPRVALDGGADGLDVQRRVVAGAPRWLAPGGHLLIETSERQAPSLVAAVTRAGLIGRVVTSADADEEATVVVGTQPVGVS